MEDDLHRSVFIGIDRDSNVLEQVQFPLKRYTHIDCSETNFDEAVGFLKKGILLDMIGQDPE